MREREMETTSLERVMAYVDGELDGAARADFERALAVDAALRAAVERERGLRARLADAYAPVLDEPVPASLQALLRPPAAVIDLSAKRAAKTAPPRRWRSAEWGALAACLVLGVALGVIGGGGWRGAAPADAVLAQSTGGALVAQGRLDRALTHALAAEPGGVEGGEGVAVGLSFATRDGALCRSFALDGAAPAAGLACRRGGAWQVQALAPAAADASGAYRQAATSLPPQLLQLVDQWREGDVFDAAAERAARERGWTR